MRPRGPVLVLTVFGLLAAAPALAQTEYIIPQTALSPCRVLERMSMEDVAPGTAIAVSADGRFVARYFHTIRGAEIALHDSETAQVRQIEIKPSELPPGLTWQVRKALFSPDAQLLAVETVGTTWVFSTATGEPLYQIGIDTDKQLYPAQLQLAGGRLLLAFWPPESVLADAEPKSPVEVRLYEAATGKWAQTVFLPLRTPDAWTRLALSSAGDRIAALERATRWPGKARLSAFSAADGAKIWQRKIGAEDLAWVVDSNELIVLGSKLTWLDAATGKDVRSGPKKVRFSEYQRLMVNSAAHVAAGFLLRYSPWKRTFGSGQASEPQFLLWRLDNGAPQCELKLDESQRVDAWITTKGEILALEETYDVRPGLRILRAAKLVTYKLLPNP